MKYNNQIKIQASRSLSLFPFSFIVFFLSTSISLSLTLLARYIVLACSEILNTLLYRTESPHGAVLTMFIVSSASLLSMIL